MHENKNEIRYERCISHLFVGIIHLTKIIYTIQIYFLSISNPSRRTMALGLTQPLTEMVTWNFPWLEGEIMGGRH
jgi:hypothetical protein